MKDVNVYKVILGTQIFNYVKKYAYKQTTK